MIYTTPPELQGQNFKVSYSSDEAGVYMREESSQGISLWFIPWDDFFDHEKTFRPWNKAPNIPDNLWVRR